MTTLSPFLFLALGKPFLRTRLQRNLHGMHTTEISHTHRCLGWQHSQHFVNCCCRFVKFVKLSKDSKNASDREGQRSEWEKGKRRDTEGSKSHQKHLIKAKLPEFHFTSHTHSTNNKKRKRVRERGREREEAKESEKAKYGNQKQKLWKISKQIPKVIKNHKLDEVATRIQRPVLNKSMCVCVCVV